MILKCFVKVEVVLLSIQRKLIFESSKENCILKVSAVIGLRMYSKILSKFINILIRFQPPTLTKVENQPNSEYNCNWYISSV